MRAAVVGHVEWVHYVRVDHVPARGEIVHADASWEEPAGGGAAAAGQLSKLVETTILFTALGDDDLGRRAQRQLTAMGLRVEAAFRPEVTRRAITHVDAAGERTITVVGERLAPFGRDPLPWDELSETDAVYFTAGDVDALHKARRARVLVATARVLPVLMEGGVELDALVGSDIDESERYSDGQLHPPPRLVVRTRGEEGGVYWAAGGGRQRYDPAPVPGPIVDRYGAGDSFAAGLAYALASGRNREDAVAFAARCGAAVLAGRGAYEGQLRLRQG